MYKLQDIGFMAKLLPDRNLSKMRFHFPLKNLDFSTREFVKKIAQKPEENEAKSGLAKC